MKTKRIISLLLALTLLAGVFFVLPVYAEEAEGQQIKILAQNVVYGEKIQIAYAVECSVADAKAGNVKVTYVDSEGVAKNATLWKNGEADLYEGQYPVFVTSGFHANEFTEVVDAVAYTGDAIPADATYKSYSVGHYFYAMLYKKGYINKTEADGTDFARKNLYESAIAYGSYAQDVLDKSDDTDPNTLLNRYSFLWTEDEGVTINGDSSALVAPGTEVSFGGAAAYMITIDGETVDSANIYTAEAGKAVKVSAKSEDVITVMDYENGAYNEFVKSYNADGDLITGNLPANANTLTMGLAADGDNTFLQVRNYANSNKVGKTEINLSNTIQTGNCYTLEAKINIKGATAGYNFAQIKFVNNNGGEAVNLLLGYATVDGSTGLAIATTGDNASIAKGTKIFDATDKAITTATGWFTLKIELYFEGAGDATAENTYVKLYVDDILAYDGLAHWALGANINHAQIDHISAGKTHNSCYDDISFTRTDKDYIPD